MVCIDQLPYCWYLHVRDVEKTEDKISFIHNESRESLNQAEDLFDPIFCLFGFIMTGPKVKISQVKNYLTFLKKIQPDKIFPSRVNHHTGKPASVSNIKPEYNFV